MFKVVSSQPDYFCREDKQANIGGPFCANCGRGVMGQAGIPGKVSWCYGCGLNTGALPLIEVPLFWGDFIDTITFDEAQRMKETGFDPLADEENASKKGAD